MEKERIVKIIKSHYLYNSLKSLFFCLLLAIMPSMIIYALISSEIKLEYSWSEILVFLIGTFALYLSFVLLSKSLKSFKMYCHSENIPIFRILGGEEKVANIINIIENNPEYNDGKILIYDKYMLPKRDYEDLMLLDDILGIYVRVHKTNYVIDEYNIVITNKYNITHWATYHPKEKELLDQTMNILVLKCKNAKFGYTSETLEHIKNNSTEIDDNGENDGTN